MNTTIRTILLLVTLSACGGDPPRKVLMVGDPCDPGAADTDCTPAFPALTCNAQTRTCAERRECDGPEACLGYLCLNPSINRPGYCAQNCGLVNVAGRSCAAGRMCDHWFRCVLP